MKRVNTRARLVSALKAAEASGLVVRRVTIAVDGSITLDTEDKPAASINPKKPQAASWDDI